MLNFKQQTLVYQSRIVMGVTRFKGEIEKEQIDVCSVLIALPLNESSGDALGFGISKMSFGTSEHFERFKGLDFPCEMECAFSSVANGSGKEKTVLIDVRPIKATK